jgi:hypothetical protein
MQHQQMNDLIARFVRLAQQSAARADTALRMGDWVLRNLGV